MVSASRYAKPIQQWQLFIALLLWYCHTCIALRVLSAVCHTSCSSTCVSHGCYLCPAHHFNHSFHRFRSVIHAFQSCSVHLQPIIFACLAATIGYVFVMLFVTLCSKQKITPNPCDKRCYQMPFGLSLLAPIVAHAATFVRASLWCL